MVPLEPKHLAVYSATWLFVFDRVLCFCNWVL